MSAPAKPYLGRAGMNVAVVLLRLAAGAALLLAVVLPVNQLTQSGGTVAVTLAGAGEDRPLDLAGLPAGVSVTDPDAEAALQAFNLPAGLRVMTEVPTSLAAIAAAVGALLLARLIASVSAGRPFDRRNPGRLAGLAAAVLLGGTVVPLTRWPVTGAVLEHLGLEGADAPVGLADVVVPLTPVLIALALLTAAEAFRRGGALEAEVEGMV